ncbi:F420H2 dehydrogenase subunit FpoC [Methanohalobium sp.]|uniref:F420H2 dehydrogenase subunit FpoC n=1 Tax=Methanohalobium sp. TaxID=2837493 RepID=UPI0025FEBDFA|nr:F420H2 dehydrogenase subunit FpoC [Methanohalobium sp.]
MDANTIVDSLSSTFPEAISDATVKSDIRVTAYIDKDHVKEVCEYLKNDLDFNHLCCESGVDYILRNEFEVVYHIASYEHPVVLALKARLNRDDPVIESIVDVYWNANWYERETYELFGIMFKYHPNLKPLVLPEDLLGDWPLRKDYEGFPQKTAKNLV